MLVTVKFRVWVWVRVTLTQTMKYKTVFNRIHICRYENCMVGFVGMGHGFGSSEMRRLRRELML